MFLKCLPWAFTKVSDGADSVSLTQELDFSSVDLPHWRPQTQIWTNMILIIWTFGVVTLTITSHAASIPWPWQMFLKCLPWAFTKVSDGADSVPLTQDLDLSCDWRPQTQIWTNMGGRGTLPYCSLQRWSNEG
ncbi:unnamed protein product [Boreogadus saida]